MNVKYCVLAPNGSLSLYLGLRALNIKAGELAAKARDRSKKDILIAVSLPAQNDTYFADIREISVIKKDFDEALQSEWFMPDEYKNLDIYNYFLNKAPDEPEEMARVCEELHEYEKRGMFNLLKFLVYLVDIMRENNIVWGVGRGSSVASYVLYLIGIHKINSIQYGLDWHEFMR